MGPSYRKDTMLSRFTKRSVNVRAHAILDSGDKVLVVALYPRDDTRPTAQSRVIIPIPDSGPKPKPGWFYNRSTNQFQREQPQ